MAASDATYRNIKALHVVFAVSSIVMLITIIAMFAEDYYRDWKIEQRLFYDVEEEMAKRAVLKAAPTEEDIGRIAAQEKELREKKEALNKARAEMEKGLGDLPSRKIKTENRYATAKAEFDSVMTFYNKATEQHEQGAQSAEALRYKKQLDELAVKMEDQKRQVEENQAAYDREARAAGLPAMAEDIAKREKTLKADLADFDRFVKLVSQKHWSSGEFIRNLPVLDGFAAATKIQQYTLNDLPIDYSFKYVTRYDRCTTCHLGMEKIAYDVAALTRLTDDPGRDKDLANRLRGAKEVLKARREAGAKDLPKDKEIEPRRIDPERLTAGRIKQFAAHPRLDLFVDANSPHNAERFGCSICHAGQGSATAFFEASHSPSDALTKQQWAEKYHWHPNHYWDYTMLAGRFVESSCLKCHHEVTDLIRDGNREEAPKLLKGYNLVRELGCFGCHEIAGIKSGRKVGPDLRLEPDPPLEAMPAADRAKALADPLNPPGQMRRVGPNLNRLAEKTNEDWVRLWLKSPRGFRENTKMPHFYLQANNRPDVLPDEQKKFPDNEIHSIAHYLLHKSGEKVDELKKYHGEKPEVRQADSSRVETLRQQMRDLDKQLADPKLKDEQKKEISEKIAQVQKDIEDQLARIKKRDDILAMGPPVATVELPKTSDAKRGRMLFQERGCMACHVHEATEKAGEAVEGKTIPPILGDAGFAPELSRVALKLAPQGGKPDDAKRWLVSWLLNPSAHNPRTLMPDTQLSLEQAGDVAEWLLSQKPEWKVADEAQVPPADSETLQKMAQLYLRKILTMSEAREVLETKKGFTAGRLRELQRDNKVDELELGGDFKGKNDDEIIPIDDHKLKMYVGRKAIGNMGCYACHSIPGFESAKPIGTALNEWGKKDVERLAFEDAHKFVEHHFNVVTSRTDPKDKTKPAAEWKIKEGKKPYESFFADMLKHEGHSRAREGFLHLKLEEPRSYDYNRLRTWDDRLRMPQFKFSRARTFAKKRAGEEDKDYYQRLRDELLRFGMAAPQLDAPTKAQIEDLESKLLPLDQQRLLIDEAEAREAVMTFILGLVAEPIPVRYVHTPGGDKLNEVKGRQVIDKFNCAGCHLIRPGSVEFKSTGGFASFEELPKIYKHEKGYENPDHYFPDHIAWAGRDQTGAERVTVKGVLQPNRLLISDEEETSSPNLSYWLMQAFRFRKDNKKDGPLRDFPASATLPIPLDSITRSTPQFGGRFIEQIVPYLQKKDRETFGGGGAKLSLAYASAPPTLIFQGEKTQPDWLYRFLRNPQQIRPQTVLRMPKFNMSPDEAQALVNYFGAVDKTQNVGIGLTYPYVSVPQRDEAYLLQKTAEYVGRLRAENQYDARKKELQAFWESSLAAQKAEADKKLQEAEERLKAAPADGKAIVQQQRDEAKKLADQLAEKLMKKDVSELVRRWETREAYVADASRLVVHANLCLTCHDAGGVKGKEQKGPNLDTVSDRLRPDWTRLWVANPFNFLHYDSVMPLNFPSAKNDYQDAFVGKSADQIQAVRDYMTLYPQYRDWPILKARPILGTGTPPPMGGQ